MTQLMGGPASQRVRFQLWVDGEVGSKEIENLIRILEIQRGWLLEDEAEYANAGPPASSGEGKSGAAGDAEPTELPPLDASSEQGGEGL